MTAQSRNAGYRTVTSNTTFTYTSPYARMRDGRNTVYNISQPQNRQGTQDDGTMATKHVSKILNGTLKAYGWITFTKPVGTQRPVPPSLKIDLEMGSSYLHFFRHGNKTYCNGFPIKTYMTGPIFLGCFSKLATWDQDRVDQFSCRYLSSPQWLCLHGVQIKSQSYRREARTSVRSLDVLSKPGDQLLFQFPQQS